MLHENTLITLNLQSKKQIFTHYSTEALSDSSNLYILQQSQCVHTKLTKGAKKQKILLTISHSLDGMPNSQFA